jgi:hypothetical protein
MVLIVILVGVGPVISVRLEGVKMDEKYKQRENEAYSIARELIFILHGCREAFPGAYEYFMGEMDVPDEAIDDAFNLFFVEDHDAD